MFRAGLLQLGPLCTAGPYIVLKFRDFTQVNNVSAGQVYDHIWELKGIQLVIQSHLFIDIEVTRGTICY